MRLYICGTTDTSKYPEGSVASSYAQTPPPESARTKAPETGRLEEASVTKPFRVPFGPEAAARPAICPSRIAPTRTDRSVAMAGGGRASGWVVKVDSLRWGSGRGTTLAGRR